MLTRDDAKAIAVVWRPRFHDPEQYTTSVERYLERVPAPSRDAGGLERWLAKDAEQEDVRGVLLEPRQTSVENARQDLPELVDDCPTCRGQRWVRRELPAGHAEFGKAMGCPMCGGRPTGRAGTRVPGAERNRCSQCGTFEDESAGQHCGNPRWHVPNWSSGDYPDARPVPGWKRAV